MPRVDVDEGLDGDLPTPGKLLGPVHDPGGQPLDLLAVCPLPPEHLRRGPLGCTRDRYHAPALSRADPVRDPIPSILVILLAFFFFIFIFRREVFALLLGELLVLRGCERCWWSRGFGGFVQRVDGQLVLVSGI